MKLSSNYHHHLFENWKVFFTTSLTCLSILHRSSDVSGATLNVITPPTSNGISPPPQPHIDQPEGLEQGISNRILAEILHLDSLKCFPKLLCNIYQDEEITRQGFFVNATELGLAYIKLIKAVHYTPKRRTTTTTEAPIRRKQPIIQVFKIPLGLITSSTYQGRRSPFKRHHRPRLPHHHRLEADDDDEDYDDLRDYHSRYPSRAPPLPFDDDDDNDDDEDSYFPSFRRFQQLPRTRNPEDEEEREYLREKIQMTQLMQNLKREDNAELEGPGSGGLATTLLQSFLPFVGARSGRSLNPESTTANQPSRGRKSRKKSQSPFWKAVTMWRKLKRRSQCHSMYKSCPMEPWEIVRMLDLVKGQSRVLSTYLKITVDKVKPKRKKQKE